jgi:hypothetical protein
MVDLKQVKLRFRRLKAHLDERTRRLFAAAESEANGRGGISAVSAGHRYFTPRDSARQEGTGWAGDQARGKVYASLGAVARRRSWKTRLSLWIWRNCWSL